MIGFKKGDIVVRRNDIPVSQAWEVYCKNEGIGLYDPVEVLYDCKGHNTSVVFRCSTCRSNEWTGYGENFILYSTQTSIDDWI